MSEELIENGIIPDVELSDTDENSTSSTPEDTDKLEKLERKIDENSTSISKLNIFASTLSNKSFLSKIEISEPDVDTSSMGDQEKKEVYNTHILSYLTSLEGDGLYTFINNSNGSLENFLMYDFNFNNEHKGIEGLVLKDGNDIYIYYINEVTYKCIITPEHEVEKEDGSTETIPSQYEWSRKIISNIGQNSNNEGHIMILDPVDNQSYKSDYLFSDFLKRDVIKGVLSVYEGSLELIISGVMYPLFRDVLVDIFPEITQGLKGLIRLKELKGGSDLTGEEIEELNILKYSYGEDPYTEENINKIFALRSIPVFSPDSILEKVNNSYIFNPLNISVNNSPSDKPQLPSGLYIYINYTDKSLISSEYKNEYKEVYGFCSITTPPNNPELCKQYIYYPNLSTYWRERNGIGYQWLSWNKILIKNQVYQVVWREYSNLNNLTDSGIHICDNATRYNPNDNLPISDISDFSFVLIVSNNISSIIGQTLQLTNSVTGTTKLYNRTCKNNTWSQWSESNNVIDLGQVVDEDLKQCTQEGSYKGIINVHEYGSVLRNVSEFLNYIYFLGSSAKSDGGALALPPCSIFDLDVKNNKSISEASNGVIPNIVTQTAKVQLANGVYVEVCRICKDVNRGNWTNWYGVSYSITLMDDVELISE